MKNMLRSIGIALLLIGGVSCGDYPNDVIPDPRVGEAFTLEHGQTLRVLPDELVVTFVEVTEDSRCPVGVNCLWAGQVIVKLKVRKGEAQFYETLGLGTSPVTGPGSSVLVFGRTIHLLAVNPYPEEFVMDLPIAQKDYSVELVVE